MTPPTVRTLFAVQHGAATRIGVTYEPGNDGESRGLVVSVYRTSDGPGRAPQRFRFWNPSGVTAWFEQYSKANTEDWREAYHLSGLNGGDFKRPGGAVTDVVAEAPYKAVPYLSQRDNERAPSGSCNVTSYAMLFDFYRIKTIENRYSQTEDNLEYYMRKRGLDRHAHDDLARMARAHGLKARFRTGVTLEAIRQEVLEARPVIVSGAFTRSGHIVLVIGAQGYDFIVHDPWGDYDAGYKNHNGAFCVYSQATIRNVLITKRAGRSPIWAHFVQPPTN